MGVRLGMGWVSYLVGWIGSGSMQWTHRQLWSLSHKSIMCQNSQTSIEVYCCAVKSKMTCCMTKLNRTTKEGDWLQRISAIIGPGFLPVVCASHCLVVFNHPVKFRSFVSNDLFKRRDREYYLSGCDLASGWAMDTENRSIHKSHPAWEIWCRSSRQIQAGKIFNWKNTFETPFRFMGEAQKWVRQKVHIELTIGCQ